MILKAQLSRSDLADLLRDLAPLRFDMPSKGEERCWLELESPSEGDISFSEGVGVHIRARGAFRFELRKIALRAAIPEVALLIRPSLARAKFGGQRLAFATELERAELGLEACSLASAVKQYLRPGEKLIWALADGLNASLRVATTADVSALMLMSSPDSTLDVGSDSLTFELSFRGTFVRSGAPAFKNVTQVAEKRAAGIQRGR